MNAKTVNKADYRKNDTILLLKSNSEYLMLNFRAGLEREEMEKGVTFQNCLYDILKIFRGISIELSPDQKNYLQVF